MNRRELFALSGAVLVEVMASRKTGPLDADGVEEIPWCEDCKDLDRDCHSCGGIVPRHNSLMWTLAARFAPVHLHCYPPKMQVATSDCDIVRYTCHCGALITMPHQDWFDELKKSWEDRPASVAPFPGGGAVVTVEVA